MCPNLSFDHERQCAGDLPISKHSCGDHGPQQHHYSRENVESKQCRKVIVSIVLVVPVSLKEHYEGTLQDQCTTTVAVIVAPTTP